jgi:ACS family hexuronate transporter-like MFS transporter
VAIALRSGWRAAFVVTGVLGLAWIPLWNWAARRTSTTPLPKLQPGASTAVLRDRRLWAFVAANALNMTGYYLWFNWTTLYLVDVHHLTQQQSAWYAWIPPLFAGLGGFFGGWLSLRMMERGVAAPEARFGVCFGASVIALPTVALPLAPDAAWASALISLGIFAVAAFSVNMYTLPLDTFGGAPAAFAVGILVASYGAVSAVISPVIGAVIDAHGYAPVTTVVAFTPLAACAVLWGTRSVR